MDAHWMKPAHLAIVLAIAGLGAVPAADAGENWAQPLFMERGHDFGPVPRGSVVRHNFVLVNRTAQPLTILDVRASCGCTTGRALSNQVAPGQEAVIEAQMDTRNFVGIKATTLTVTLVTAQGNQGEARLMVRSNILSDIVMEPGTAGFGVVSKGQAPQQAIRIERLGAPQWKILRMAAGQRLGQFITANLQETRRSAQGVSYMLTVDVRPDAPAGSIHEEIRLSTNDSETPVVPVLVTIEVRGGLTASPTSLALGRASAAGPLVQGRILVRGNRPFAITAIEGNGDGFTAAADSDSKALHVVNVAYRADQAPVQGDLKHTFRIVTDLPDEAPLEVQASVQSAP
jgi:hypothetical protein